MISLQYKRVLMRKGPEIVLLFYSGVGVGVDGGGGGVGVGVDGGGGGGGGGVLSVKKLRLWMAMRVSSLPTTGENANACS
jgi:hypothetical protein